MKRKRNSRAHRPKGTNEEAEAGEVKIQHSGCSIMNLPSHILVGILLKLPIKDIIFCTCTCKSWYATISNPEFANVHYAQSEVFPIVRTRYLTSMSRSLYLLELEKDERFMDRFSCQECYGSFERSCVCQVNMKLDYKLKLPLHNLQLISKDSINGNDEDDSEFVYDYHHKIVNSCNGFLCLSEPTNNNPVVVCNPITGEFINLPQVTEGKNLYDFNDYIDCGFGFSPKNNQYKVVKIFKQDRPSKHVLIPEDRVVNHDTIVRFIGLAQVHNVGTESWKDIEGASYWGYKLTYPTYLNGALHWFCFNDKEDYVGMGVLEGCLCVCDSSNSRLPCVWVMKEYGVRKSWTKVFEIDMCYCDRCLNGLYQPIKYMNNGALLMFNYPSSCLLYYDPSKPGLKRFLFRGIKSKAETIAHTPSFISLKDVLAGCNVEVLNV